MPVGLVNLCPEAGTLTRGVPEGLVNLGPCPAPDADVVNILFVADDTTVGVTTAVGAPDPVGTLLGPVDVTAVGARTLCPVPTAVIVTPGLITAVPGVDVLGVVVATPGLITAVPGVDVLGVVVATPGLITAVPGVHVLGVVVATPGLTTAVPGVDVLGVGVAMPALTTAVPGVDVPGVVVAMPGLTTAVPGADVLGAVNLGPDVAAELGVVALTDEGGKDLAANVLAVPAVGVLRSGRTCEVLILTAPPPVPPVADTVLVPACSEPGANLGPDAALTPKLPVGVETLCPEVTTLDLGVPDGAPYLVGDAVATLTLPIPGVLALGPADGVLGLGAVDGLLVLGPVNGTPL